MMICVQVDQVTGVLSEATFETAPNCSQFALLSPAEFDTMTYWAQLAIELDPSGDKLYPLMTATLLVFITAFGVRQIARLILNR